MTNLFNVEPFLELLDNGSTLVTANSRQSAKIRAAYSNNKNATQKVCLAPELYSINNWIEAQWQIQTQQSGHQNWLVLNPIQRLLLWQDIIDQDIDSLPLVKTDQLYSQADAAFRVLTLWQEDINPWPSEDPVHGLFKKWFNIFSTKLKDKCLLIPEQRQEILLDILDKQPIKPVQQLHLYGFDDLPPLTELMLSASAQELIKHELSADKNSSCYHQTWPTKNVEITAAARWAKSCLSEDPNLTIGVIAPNLGQIRDEIEQVFTETFELETFNIEKPRYTLPFNFSAGTPLAKAPVVGDALLLLQLITNSVSFDAACSLACSPFWLIDNATHTRFKLLDKLARNPKNQISSSTFRRLLESDTDCPLLTALLAIDESIRRLAKQMSANSCMDLVLSLLNDLGWPGARRLDSIEYQQVMQFQKLLEHFVSIEVVKQTVSLQQAIDIIENLANNTPFQAQTPESPIQILGALEGAALSYDLCWVLQCDNQTWPPPPAPSPLIPVDIQRNLDMPNASASKQLRFARSLTEKLTKCAKHVVFSSCETEGSSELSPSALVANFAKTTLVNDKICPLTDGKITPPMTQWRELNQDLFDQRKTTWVDCESAPALRHNIEQHGGVALIGWQAALPFNAFCRYRLKLHPLKTIEHHLPPTIRGDISHLAMANIWRKLKNQQALVNLSINELNSLVVEQVHASVEYYRDKTTHLTPERRTLECERQIALILQWLELEKRRPGFEVIGIEQPIQAEIEGLKFQLQIDRIDNSSDELIVIDYKSGSVSSTSQFSPERLSSPQLPLYACYWPEPISAIAFAVINKTRLKLDGLGELSVNIEGIKTSDKVFNAPWPDLKAAWLNDISTTVKEFREGITLNHVYDKKQVEFQTDYLPLNRLLEMPSNFTLWAQEQSHEQ